MPGSHNSFHWKSSQHLDLQTIQPLLEKYLGPLAASGAHEQARDLHIYTPAGRIEATARAGREPRATVNL